MRKKKKEEIIIPVLETDPVANAENGDKTDLEKAVEMAKKWVEENKL